MPTPMELVLLYVETGNVDELIKLKDSLLWINDDYKSLILRNQDAIRLCEENIPEEE